MKKLILLLIVLCSYSSFAQFENYPITNVGILSISSINATGVTVPQGKVWKVVSGRYIRVTNLNGEIIFTSSYIGYESKTTTTSSNTTWMKNMVIPSGFQVYANGNDGVFNYIEYDLSQQLSNAEPKIDNRPTLFPNPTNSMLSLNSDKNYKIQVFDLNGRKLMEQNGNSLNMEHLSNATYVVKAMDVDTKEMLSYKVVKE
jgi:hypothetical protein